VKIFLATIETSTAGADQYAFTTLDEAITYVGSQVTSLARDADDIWIRKIAEGSHYLYHVRFGGDHDQAYVTACDLKEAS
jgi:hypothetical protein